MWMPEDAPFLRASFSLRRRFLRSRRARVDADQSEERARSILLHINAELSLRSKSHCMWRYIGSYETIPNDRDLMVAVIDGDELHIVEFPCRWREGCWIEANTGRMIDVRPTHWRQWSSE
jgi:hypothetical protein